MFRAYVQLLSPDRCVTHGRDVGHQRNGRREFALIFLFVFHSELFLGALWTGKVGLVLFRSGTFWCPFDGGGQGERCGAIPEWIRVHPAEMQAAKVAWFSCDAITLNRWNESVFLSIEFIVDRSIEEEEESILVKFRNASDFIRPSYWLSKSRHFVCWTETIHPPCGVIPEHNGRNAMSGTLRRRSGMDWTHSGRNNPFLSRGSVAPKAIPEFMEFAAIPEWNEIQRRMFARSVAFRSRSTPRRRWMKRAQHFGSIPVRMAIVLTCLRLDFKWRWESSVSEIEDDSRTRRLLADLNGAAP